VKAHGGGATYGHYEAWSCFLTNCAKVWNIFYVGRLQDDVVIITFSLMDREFLMGDYKIECLNIGKN
jgi:hypothetical protein